MDEALGTTLRTTRFRKQASNRRFALAHRTRARTRELRLRALCPLKFRVEIRRCTAQRFVLRHIRGVHGGSSGLQLHELELQILFLNFFHVELVRELRTALVELTAQRFRRRLLRRELCANVFVTCLLSAALVAQRCQSARNKRKLLTRRLEGFFRVLTLIVLLFDLLEKLTNLFFQCGFDFHVHRVDFLLRMHCLLELLLLFSQLVLQLTMLPDVRCVGRVALFFDVKHLRVKHLLLLLESIDL